jgi:pimeloyl-ACP methyl ester carboxylesterase
LFGTRDPDFDDPLAEARWIADQMHGEVHMIEGAGHYPHAEMPAETAALILPFLGKVFARRKPLDEQPSRVLAPDRVQP